MNARVTVFDNSKRQLEKDILVAKRENLIIKTLKGDMQDLSIFSNEEFDIIFHPISNPFIENPQAVWNESYRILKKGGLLLSGFVNPLVYLFDLNEMNNGRLVITNTIPYSDLEQISKIELEERIKNNEPIEFGHSLETLIGGQLKAGFVITDFYEDIINEDIIDKHINTTIATKAIK